MLTDLILGWARTGVAVGCGYLIARGYITHDQGGELIGAAGTVVPILLSALDKVVARQRTATAVVAMATQASGSRPVSGGRPTQ